MQKVIGSIHGHEVGRRFLADDEPLHEQYEVDRATKHQVGAGLGCVVRSDMMVRTPWEVCVTNYS